MNGMNYRKKEIAAAGNNADGEIGSTATADIVTATTTEGAAIATMTTNITGTAIKTGFGPGCWRTSDLVSKKTEAFVAGLN